jgi:Rrf2 family transcriptional regulator, iron-sulfur cluster assembly transcription factor
LKELIAEYAFKTFSPTMFNTFLQFGIIFVFHGQILNQVFKLQLSMIGEYALRAMLYICSKPFGTSYQISEIAEKNGIPDNFLRKIIPLLKKANLLNSQRGNGGGITLQKRAEDITPLEIINAVEGPILLNKCLIHDKFCSRDDFCSFHTLWADAQQQLKDKLASRNLSELAIENNENYIRVMSSHKKSRKL